MPLMWIFTLLCSILARPELPVARLPIKYSISAEWTAPRAGGGRCAFAAALLRTTPLTAERLQALIRLLRAEDPPAFAIQRWHYVVDETPAAWSDLRSAAENALERLPSSARQALDAIDAYLDAALRSGSRSALEAYGEALTQLESIPGLIAVLSDRFLSWKTPQRIVRRSVGALPPSQPEAAAIPKEPQTKELEMAAPEEGRIDRPTADGGEAGPKMTAPEAPAGQTPSAEAEALQVNFHTEVRFPASVRRWEVNWLIVRLRLEAPEATIASATAACCLCAMPIARRRPGTRSARARSRPRARARRTTGTRRSSLIQRPFPRAG